MLDNLDYSCKLLQNTSFSSEFGLLWKEQYVCSFVPCVTSMIGVQSSEKTEYLVELYLMFSDGTKSDLITLPLSGLERSNWFDLDIRCQANPDCPKAGKYLAYIIRHNLSNVPTVKVYSISRLGLHIVEGVPVFNIGGRLIRPPCMDNNTDIALEPLQYKLAVDTERYSESQAVASIMDLVNLSLDAGSVIFSQVLLSVMRAVYVDMGVTPRCVVFLVGKSGNKKTTYATFHTQLYDRDKGIEHPMRLNASISAAESILYEKNDCTVVLDDLFPAKSSSIKRSQETVLIELTRIIGDNSGRARMNGKQVVVRQPQCSVILTGEYLIGTGSDAARLLPIEFSTPIDSVKLHKCQNEPLILSTFYYYFISWYVTNYFEIKDLLIKWLTDFR